ncbi:hypothetical protein [Kitasatospora fiedleri]|uniref:hypothetical protein n=1 Tax=Kitasatospora fiedleri TaxID=2991545 RepID=UPI002499D373|nr:hypothetical protein [Kitasatospora fiedleri]
MRSRLAAGPPPPPAVAPEDRRYALTDTLDGLRGCTDPEGPGRFTAAVEEVLDRVGGPLRAGYARGRPRPGP